MEEEKVTSLVNIEDVSLEESQLSEQLYNSAGLDPVVDAGLKDYDKLIQQENKFINKVLGPRGSDIRGYGESVAKRVALAIYSLLNKQYGGKVGDMRSYIMSLEDEKNRANIRYDELMGRVIGILGDEYKNLRTDSSQFMEKLNVTLGDDLKETRINQDTLMERLADIDGLKNRIHDLEQENRQLKEKHEQETAALKKEHEKATGKIHSGTVAMEKKHAEETGALKAQVSERDAKITVLESEKSDLAADLEREQQAYQAFRTAVIDLIKKVPDEEKRTQVSEELYKFIIKDSKVPGMVLEGVGKFIDFNKYLGIAVEKGAGDLRQEIENLVDSPGNAEKQS